VTYFGPSSVEAIKVPVGTTAQRPATPTGAGIRFNSTLLQYEVYANSQWIKLG
jgi:hypothetical protein